MPNVIKTIFGPEKAAKIYGISFTYTGLSSLLLFILSCSSIVDTENTSKVSCYEFMFYLGSGLSTVALILLLTLFNEEPYYKKENEDSIEKDEEEKPLLDNEKRPSE